MCIRLVRSMLSFVRVLELKLFYGPKRGRLEIRRQVLNGGSHRILALKFVADLACESMCGHLLL